LVVDVVELPAGRQVALELVAEVQAAKVQVAKVKVAKVQATEVQAAVTLRTPEPFRGNCRVHIDLNTVYCFSTRVRIMERLAALKQLEIFVSSRA
jgi:hypothetical protein